MGFLPGNGCTNMYWSPFWQTLSKQPHTKLLLTTSPFPDSIEEFQGYLEGYGIVLLALCSEHNRAVQNYITNIVNQCSELITYIEQMFPSQIH